jgi:methionyl-tRNA formyltransferase
MKVAILTTQTFHHAWYLSELKKVYPSIVCIVETASVNPPFDVKHSFEKDRDEYEAKHFFAGEHPHIKNICESGNVGDINDAQTFEFLKKHSPDILISFGSRKIERKLIDIYKNRIINLHGGDPERYRGLDSHLWAIYHNEWSAIVTTLHMLNAHLDDGEIIQKSSLDLAEISSLAQLRALNTQACLKLSLAALKAYEMFGSFITASQQTQGRYYSFMPADLKEICQRKFTKYLKL